MSVRHTHQDMPNIFIGSLKGAEANADPQEALTAPHGAGCNRCLPHRQRLATVQQQLGGSLHVHLQHLFQGVIVFVLSEKKTFKSLAISLIRYETFFGSPEKLQQVLLLTLR